MGAAKVLALGAGEGRRHPHSPQSEAQYTAQGHSSVKKACLETGEPAGAVDLRPGADLRKGQGPLHCLLLWFKFFLFQPEDQTLKGFTSGETARVPLTLGQA